MKIINMPVLKNIKPTESELEILQILWDEGPLSVREVNDLLIQKKEQGYTTTLKLMQIMNEKGLTVRNTEARSHIYTARVKEASIKNGLLDSFISAAFKGSAASLVMQALGSQSATREELDEIKSLIRQLESDKNEEL